MSLHSELTKKVPCAKEGCPDYTTKGDLCKDCRKKVGVAIKESDILKGTKKQNKGLFATRAFKKNEIVGEYKGEKFTDREGNASDYIIEAGDRNDKVYIDANVQTSCVVRYVNSSQNTPKSSNCDFRRANDFDTKGLIYSEYLPEKDNPKLIRKKDQKKHVYVVTSKAVEKGEEFLINYGTDYHLPFSLRKNKDGRIQANLIRSNAKNTPIEDFEREVNKLYDEDISILDLKDNSFGEEGTKTQVPLIREFIQKKTSLTTLIMSSKKCKWSQSRFDILSDVEKNTHLTTLDISNISLDDVASKSSRRRLRDKIRDIFLYNKFLLNVDLSEIYFFETTDVLEFISYFQYEDKLSKSKKGLSYSLDVSGVELNKTVASYIPKEVDASYANHKAKFTITVNIEGTIKHIQHQETNPAVYDVFSSPGSSADGASDNEEHGGTVDSFYVHSSASESSWDGASDNEEQGGTVDSTYIESPASESSSDGASGDEEQGDSGAPVHVESSVSEGSEDEDLDARGDDKPALKKTKGRKGSILDIRDLRDKSPEATLAFETKNDSNWISMQRILKQGGKRKSTAQLLNYKKDKEVCQFCLKQAYRTSRDIPYCKRCEKKGYVKSFFEGAGEEAIEEEPDSDEAENETDIDKATEEIEKAAKQKSRNQELYPFLNREGIDTDEFSALFDNRLDARAQRLQLEITTCKQAKNLFEKYEAQVKESKKPVPEKLRAAFVRRLREYESQLDEVQKQTMRDRLEIRGADMSNQQAKLEYLIEGYKSSDQKKSKRAAIEKKIGELDEIKAKYADMQTTLTTQYSKYTKLSKTATARRINPLPSGSGAFVLKAPPRVEKKKRGLKRKAVKDYPGASKVESSERNDLKRKAGNAFPGASDAASPRSKAASLNPGQGIRISPISDILGAASKPSTSGAASAAPATKTDFKPRVIKKVIEKSEIISGFDKHTPKFGWTDELGDKTRWMIKVDLSKVLNPRPSTSAASVSSIAASHYQTVEKEIYQDKRVQSILQGRKRSLKEVYYHVVLPVESPEDAKIQPYSKNDASTYSVLVPLLNKSNNYIMQFAGSETKVRAKVGNIYVYRNDSTLKLFQNTSKRGIHYITYTFEVV